MKTNHVSTKKLIKMAKVTGSCARKKHFKKEFVMNY